MRDLLHRRATLFAGTLSTCLGDRIRLTGESQRGEHVLVLEAECVERGRMARGEAQEEAEAIALCSPDGAEVLPGV